MIGWLIWNIHELWTEGSFHRYIKTEKISSGEIALSQKLVLVLNSTNLYPIEVRRRAPLQDGSGSGVQIIEVLGYSWVDPLQQRHVVQFFVELVAAYHEDEQNQAQGPHQAAHLHAYVSQCVPREWICRLLSRSRLTTTISPTISQI